LGHFEGQKTVIIFSEGFLSEPKSHIRDKVQEAIDLALRYGIVLNFVNPLDVSGREGYFDLQMGPEDDLARYTTIEQMAKYTGGIFHNDNSMINGIKEITRRKLYRYVMSYTLPPGKRPGSYRKIRVEVNQPGLELSYIKGYYVPKEELSFQNSKKEDILNAVYAPGNIQEIPVKLSYNYSLAADGANYAVSFLTRVNIQKMKFYEEEKRRKNLLHLVLAVFDEAGNYVNGLEKAVDFQLLESSYADLLNQGIDSKCEFKLAQGRYTIKSIVREDNQGKLGSISKTIEIP
jgi:hypothetical protein